MVANSASPPSAPLPQSETWADAIADEGLRGVFLHIAKHGVVTESELATLLGSTRAARRFSQEVDAHLSKLPFGIRTEPAEGGKRYVREADR